MKLTDVPAPLEGADPVPVQPVQKYLVLAPETGEVTEDEAVEPLSYHP